MDSHIRAEAQPEKILPAVENYAFRLSILIGALAVSCGMLVFELYGPGFGSLSLPGRSEAPTPYVPPPDFPNLISGYTDYSGLERWITAATGTPFVFTNGSFSLAIPDGWYVAEPSDTPLPEGFSNPQFTIHEKDSSCVLTYAIGEPAYNTVNQPDSLYGETPYGEFMYLGDQQVVQWWSVPTKNIPPNHRLKLGGREPFPGEILRSDVRGLIVPPLQPATFLLYTEDGGVVTEECESVGNSILASYQPYIVPVAPDELSDGYLKPISFRTTGELYMGYQKTPDSEIKQVMELPHSYSYSSYTVHDNQLYSLSPSGGSIVVYDIFKNASWFLPGIATSTGEVVGSFAIRGDRMWYSLGPEICDECDYAVYEIPADGGTPMLLIPRIKARIMGFDPLKNILYLVGGYGDAGWLYYTIYAYNYADGSLTEIAHYDNASGADTPSNNAATSLRKSIESVLEEPRHSLVRVQNGMLSTPILDEETVRLDWTFEFAK